MSEKPRKIRISVTMTEPALADLDDIVKEGFYLSRGEIIMDAIRHFLEDYYRKSLKTPEPPEPEDIEQEEIGKEEADPELES